MTGKDQSYTVCGDEDRPSIYTTHVEDSVIVQRCRQGPAIPTASASPSSSISGSSAERGTIYSPISSVHQDTITELAVLQVPHNLLLSASVGGVIKVWK